MAHITILDKGTSRERSKITYEVRDISGKRKRKSKTLKAGTPKKEVNRIKRDIETRYENTDPLDFRKITFAEVCEEYEKLYIDKLSPSTQRNYSQIINTSNGLKKKLGSIDIKKLSVSDVQKYANELSEELSGKTVKNYILLISTILSKAQTLGYRERGENVTKYVELPKANSHKKQAYSKEEIAQLLEYTKEYALLNRNPVLELQIALEVFAGLRRSEACALTIEDCDMDKRIIHINKARVYGLNGDEVKGTKTVSGERDIPMTEYLYKILKRRIAKYNKDKISNGKDFCDSRALFSSEKGVPYHVNSFNNRYTRLQKFCGKKGLRYLPQHYLRHTFCSLLVESGADILVVKELAGHSSVDITLDVYSNSYDDKKRECLKELNTAVLNAKVQYAI